MPSNINFAKTKTLILSIKTFEATGKDPHFPWEVCKVCGYSHRKDREVIKDSKDREDKICTGKPGKFERLHRKCRYGEAFIETARREDREALAELEKIMPQYIQDMEEKAGTGIEVKTKISEGIESFKEHIEELDMLIGLLEAEIKTKESKERELKERKAKLVRSQEQERERAASERKAKPVGFLEQEMEKAASENEAWPVGYLERRERAEWESKANILKFLKQERKRAAQVTGIQTRENECSDKL